MQKWEPDADPHQARRVGKSIEEGAEWLAVLGRISVQGMTGVDPASGKTNRQRLMDETADLRAQLICNDEAFDWSDVEWNYMVDRICRKIGEMRRWEAHLPKRSV